MQREGRGSFCLALNKSGNSGPNLLNGQHLKICTVDKSMKIPAMASSLQKSTCSAVTSFPRDCLCSGFALVCKGRCYYSQSHGEYSGSWKKGRIWPFFFLECVVAVMASVLSFLECCLLRQRGTGWQLKNLVTIQIWIQNSALNLSLLLVLNSIPLPP